MLLKKEPKTCTSWFGSQRTFSVKPQMTSIFDHFSFTLKHIPASDYCHLLPKFLRMVKSRGQKIGQFCGGHKWMTLNFKNLTVFCNIMVICGSWKSWRVVFTSGYTKKKQWFVIHNPESFNSTPGFICGFTAKIFYQERYLQSQFWFRYERSTVRSS